MNQYIIKYVNVDMIHQKIKLFIIITLLFIITQNINITADKLYSINNIDYYCKLYHIDKHLLKAIIFYESNDNQYAKNPNSSAYGKGQFIKSTGIWVAKNLNYKNYEHYKTTESQQIEMICWYLNYLNKKYDYNVKNVLLEYSGKCEGMLYVSRILCIKDKYKRNDNYITKGDK